MELFCNFSRVLLLMAIKSAFCFNGLCNNFLLHGRNITTHVSTSYGFGSPNNLYDPNQALLYSQEQTDSAGRVRIAAWTAGINNKQQYWQVDLESPSIVRAVVTQGRNGCCQQWVTAYKIFRSTDCRTFLPVRHREGEIWEANNDENSLVTNKFMCTVKAKCVRIVPETWHNHIAMRFELLGCPIKPASQLTTPSLFNNSVSISNLVTSPTSTQTDTSSFLNISKESYPTDLASTTHIVSSSSSSSPSSSLSSSTSSSSILPTVSAEAFSNSISSTATSLLMQRSTLLTTIMSGTPEHTSFWITSPENTSTTTNSNTTQPTSASTIVSSYTQTTCRDKKGVDCASMDKYFFICKDRVSATTTCPRFCGLCRTNISSHSTVTSLSASQTMIYSPAKNDSVTIPPTAPYESSWSTEMSTDSDVWTPQTSDKYYSTAIESSSQSTVPLIGSATTSLEESTVSAYPASTENMSSTTTASYKVVCDKNSSLLSAYSCDFESGLCGFNVASNPNIWVISNGPQAGIQSDHTTNSSVGGYVLFDAGGKQAPNGSVANLTITQAVPRNYVLCLSFWYSMPTSDANLSIFKHFSSPGTPDELLWQQSNMTTHGWEEASIILTANQTFQVVFSSTKTIETGYLGIDDVAVHFVGHV